MTVRLLSIVLALSGAFTLVGCSSSDKSSASLYDEDAPSMRYHDRQAPGARVGSHRYH